MTETKKFCLKKNWKNQAAGFKNFFSHSTLAARFLPPANRQKNHG